MFFYKHMKFQTNDFDDYERNLMFEETAFLILKLKFLALHYEASFQSSSQTKYCASLTTRTYFFTSFPFSTWLSNLHV